MFRVYFIFAFNVLLMSGETYVKSELINMAEYRKMPKLHLYEDYNECKERNREFVYCVVRSVLKPQNSSELWRQIVEFSKPSIHAQHALLDRGVCVQTCETIVNSIDDNSQMELFQEKFDFNFTYILNPKNFGPPYKSWKKYDRLINICINTQLREQFNMTAYSEIEYCDTFEDAAYEIGGFHIAFLTVVILITISVIASTVYDQKNKKSPYHNMLTAFSIPRNIKQFTAPPTSEIQKDFKFFEALRVISIVVIIVLHCMMGMSMIAQKNPEFLEEKMDNFFMQDLVGLFPYLVHTFFAISGMLMAVQFMDYTDKNSKFELSYFWEKLVNRVNRLIPVYGFLILFIVSWNDKFSRTINSKRFLNVETKQCQRNWWANLLFINNYLHLDEPCMQHTWYLAAEFQLFLIGLIILMFIWRFPKSLKYVIALMVLVSFVVPALVVHFREFEPILIVSAKLLRFYMWYDDDWHNLYYNPTYTNTGSYFYGMIAGIIYNKVKRNKFKLGNSKVFNVTRHLALPLVLILQAPTFLFYKYEFRYPSIFITVYAALTKNAWGFMCSVFFLGCIFGKRTTFHKILYHGFFGPLGRVTFSVYLVHNVILRIVLSNTYGATELSEYFNTIIATSTIFLSYVFGYLICITLEMPMTTILKEIFERKKPLEEKLEIQNVYTQS